MVERRNILSQLKYVYKPDIRVKAFTEPKDLASAGGRHKCDQQRVTEAMARDLTPELRPVPASRRGNSPHIEL